MASPQQQQGDARDPRLNLCPNLRPMPGYNLEFRFASDPYAERMGSLEWEAELLVKAKDLPCLMKQGFHWSEANVQEGKGYFGGLEIKKRQLDAEWWRCARVYILKDKAEDPQWDAILCVCAREMPLLSSFKIAQLSINKIDYTAAWDQNSRYVYHFCARAQGLNFNAYYDDDKPLRGWWPWPKEKKSSAVKSESEQEEWEKGWLEGEEDLM